MNGVIPALIAVLLAELGPRASIHARASRRGLLAATVAALIAAAAIAGERTAAELTDWASALLIAVALGLAGVSQLQRSKLRTSFFGAAWTFWGGGTVLLTFALATRFGALAAAVGALGGVAAAMMAASTSNLRMGAARRLAVGAALALIAAAAVIATYALRLV